MWNEGMWYLLCAKINRYSSENLFVLYLKIGLCYCIRLKEFGIANTASPMWHLGWGTAPILYRFQLPKANTVQDMPFHPTRLFSNKNRRLCKFPQFHDKLTFSAILKYLPSCILQYTCIPNTCKSWYQAKKQYQHSLFVLQGLFSQNILCIDLNFRTFVYLGCL